MEQDPNDLFAQLAAAKMAGQIDDQTERALLSRLTEDERNRYMAGLIKSVEGGPKDMTDGVMMPPFLAGLTGLAGGLGKRAAGAAVDFAKKHPVLTGTGVHAGLSAAGAPWWAHMVAGIPQGRGRWGRGGSAPRPGAARRSPAVEPKNIEKTKGSLGDRPRLEDEVREQVQRGVQHDFRGRVHFPTRSLPSNMSRDETMDTLMEAILGLSRQGQTPMRWNDPATRRAVDGLRREMKRRSPGGK